MKERDIRILAQDQFISNNTWITGINHNDLIIGPSGAGKTRGYVMPNLLQCSESVIAADTKGMLYDNLRLSLEKRGYRVLLLDFADLCGSCGYPVLSLQ